MCVCVCVSPSLSLSLPPSLPFFLPYLPPSLPPSLPQEGISLEDVKAFTELVENISDVETALGMYMAAGASITAGMDICTCT